MANSKRARDRHFEKASLYATVLQHCSPEQVVVLQTMERLYERERETLVRASTRRLNDVQIFETLCNTACKQIQNHVCCELTYADAQMTSVYCLELYSRSLKTLTRNKDHRAAPGTPTLQEVMQRVKNVREASASHTEAGCVHIRTALQYRNFITHYTSVPMLIALASGDPDGMVSMSSNIFDQHKLYGELVREELFSGALLMYRDYRLRRAVECCNKGACGLLLDRLKITPVKGMSSPEAKMHCIYNVLDRQFLAAVDLRINQFNRAHVLLEHVSQMRTRIDELDRMNETTRRRIRSLEDVV